jgi:tryptophan synthase alpha chain
MTRRKALVPFITAGYPDKARCLRYMLAFARAGADVVELGIPFSDPLADGPVIQRTSMAALERGATVRDALSIAAKFKKQARGVKLVVMTYLNPVLAYGMPDFMAAAKRAGVDGLIPVDLIPEEAEGFLQAAAAQGLEVTFLVSPTCTAERMGRIAAATTGFLYLVSVKGVTGARGKLPADLAETVARLRSVTSKPIYVGFGISTAAHAAAVAKLADGVVVGSALLERIPPNGRDRTADVRRFLSSMRRALDRSP